jgi:hypothetical protein
MPFRTDIGPRHLQQLVVICLNLCAIEGAIPSGAQLCQYSFAFVIQVALEFRLGWWRWIAGERAWTLQVLKLVGDCLLFSPFESNKLFDRRILRPFARQAADRRGE